jgi:hypothetical protein
MGLTESSSEALVNSVPLGVKARERVPFLGSAHPTQPYFSSSSVRRLCAPGSPIVTGPVPGKASRDRLPQVDAKSLDLNAFFQGLAGFSSSKRVAHAALLDIYFSKDLQK